MKRLRLLLALLPVVGFLSGCQPPVVPEDPAVCSVSLTVVESVNGTALSGSTLTVYDSSGSKVGESVTSDASGAATISLTPDAQYTIVAEKADYAQSSLVFTAPGEDESADYVVVEPLLGMVTRDAVAPAFSRVSVSHSASLDDLAEVQAGSALTTEGETFLVVRVDGENAIDATAWSGNGVSIGIDIAPSVFNEFLASAKSEVTPEDDAYAYGYEYVFDLSGYEYAAGDHELVIVAYDVANNRAELRLPITIAAVTGEEVADLSGLAISNLLVDLRSYGVSREYFSKDGSSTDAMTQVAGANVSYRGALSFTLLKDDLKTAQAIRGFRVLRSTDGVTYSLVGTQNYGFLYAPSKGVHSYFDADSKLKPGVLYYYKVVAFSSADSSVTSNVAKALVYAPYTATLVSPALGADVAVDEATEVGPAFSFSISDTSLWDAAKSDYFYFSIYVRQKAGALSYYGNFRYVFATSSFQFRYGASTWYNFEDAYGGANGDFMSYAAGVISAPSFLTFLGYTNYATAAAADWQEGTTYEWDVITAYDATNGHTPAYFSKVHYADDGTTAIGTTKTYADAISTGGSTTNGALEFTAE